MSVIANLGSSLAAALPPLNPHLHGHKKGSHVPSADDTSGSSNSTAQVPAGLQQNLFGSLLNSLEQVIGVQATAPAGAAAGTTSAAAGTATSTTSTAAGSAGPSTSATAAASAADTGAAAVAAAANTVSAAAQSSLTLLRNYLNNLLHNPRADGAAANPAGANLNVTA